jgi:hypothetical protein
LAASQLSDDKLSYLCWLTDGSNTKEGSGTREHNLNLGFHITVFQTDTYAITARIMENTKKGYTG